MQPVLSNLAAPEIVAWADELVAIRREIHAQPELGFETDRT
ncbi:MAG: amidohydrolase, partial [Duodenibacillus sp.]|nr:amidohydrolase [Duodenibacillus sp.]